MAPRILTVCLGNICRSPLAERLLALRLEEAGVSAEVSSAGLIGLVGRPMEPSAAAQLRALGGDDSGFRARRFDGPLATEADLVLALTVEIRQRLVQEAPAALRRTFTLREFALLVADADPEATDLVADAARRRSTVAHADLDVPDPMGRGEAVHAEAARLIADAVETIVTALAQRT